MSGKIFNSVYNDLEKLGKTSPGAFLSAYTTFRTGGPADILFEAAGEKEVCCAVSLLRESGTEYTVIGGGSNLLVSDSGIRGVVVRIADDNAAPVLSNGKVYASACVSKEMFINFAADNGFGGIEFMAGIPGTIGGGIFMNAGTFMGSFSDILASVKVLLADGTVDSVTMDEEISRYRKIYLPENCLILGGLFGLNEIENAQTVRDCVRDIIADRRVKHPMDYPSAGSVFKNPVGHSSWKLINDAGLKGFSIGGAKVSEKHTNFIINAGGATSADIYRLVKKVQERVFDSSGIMLETEIRLLGNFD
jgi:UDP-N-acetylmuramate dehydrogenase